MTGPSTSTAGPASLTPASFNDYNAALQTAALKATKHSAQLPTDIPFHRSVDRAFAKDLDAASARVLSLANRLLGLVSTTDSKRKGKARLENEDDVVDSFHALVVDPMDQLLERAVRNASFSCMASSPRSASNICSLLCRTFAWMNSLDARNHLLLR